MKEQSATDKNTPIFLVGFYFFVIIATIIILFSKGAFEGDDRALVYLLAVLSIAYSATPAVLNLSQKNANIFALGGIVSVVMSLVLSKM